MRKISDKERQKLSAEIAGLESLDLNPLRAQWKLLYGRNHAQLDREETDEGD